MSADPTFSPRCTCPWVDGLRHYDPTCYEHGEWPELEAPKWIDLLGIDPDFTGGVPVNEWLEQRRGEA